MELSRDDIAEIFRAEAERLMRSARPLMDVKDLAKTLNVSRRTVETMVSDGEIRPLWIKGQRRFHPDTVDAYVRAQTK